MTAKLKKKNNNHGILNKKLSKISRFQLCIKIVQTQKMS